MESDAAEEQSPSVASKRIESQDLNIESAENFQKNIYELFERNGVLNDLRAYLRRHIVSVLKSAQTGDPPACQKHFTQRLDLTFQALNILIAEYLLCLEFNYTLSVFLSEIPLANMVFDFTKTLMKIGTEENAGLRFKDNDVWSVLNYLGVKCDSDHAADIVQMYKSEEKLPLLLCLLKCMPLYRMKSTTFQHNNTSEDSLSSAKSSDCITRNASNEKCKHYAFCTACQSRYIRLREKYEKKKKGFAKDMKHSSMSQMNVDSFLKNISVMERNLIDEMFEQLTTVYEAEVDMLKAQEEQKVKRSLTSHAEMLQKQRDELEEAFKAREAELERNVQQKKQFLWGLARALRDQHEHMSRAMLAVRRETERLSAKEDNLKTQLVEAEEMLRKRGEDMRQQISNELVILEAHLVTMKSERESIQRERSELQDLHCASQTKMLNKDMNEHSQSHYDLLKNELAILKNYLESTKMESKCLIERCTMTELCDVTSKISVMLNNEQDADRSNGVEGERNWRTHNRVVNDFRKPKNVNFSQTNIDEVYRERSRERLSPASSEPGEWRDCATSRDVVTQLRAENERLKIFVRQQREHIGELSSYSARLQSDATAARLRESLLPATAPAPRPRTAPAFASYVELYNGRSVNPTVSANDFGWCKGAGEELTLFPAAPRVATAGGAVPFIGALRDRHGDSRRHLLSQWRALRRRTSPLSAVSKLRGASPGRHDRVRDGPPTSASISVPQASNVQNPEESVHQTPFNVFQFQPSTRPSQRSRSPVTPDTSKLRDKSPKTVLMEAKQNLKNKHNIKDTPPSLAVEKSPSSVLREAKLRLRKLEIEAEAVEQSYLNFRRRQKDESVERKLKDSNVTNVGSLGIRRSRSLQKLDETYTIEDEAAYSQHVDTQAIKKDFDKYFRVYESKLDIGRFKNKNTAAEIIKPIPESYSNFSNEEDKAKEKSSENYLETPLTEFRKLYHSQEQTRPFRIVDNSKDCKPYIALDNTVKDNFPKTLVPNNEKDMKTVDDKNNEQKDLEAVHEHLEILKDGTIEEKVCSNESDLYSPKTRDDNLSLLKSDITKESLTTGPPETQPIEVTKPDGEKPDEHSVKNLLTVEIETINEANSLKITESNGQDVFIVVQSSVDAREVVQTESEENGQQLSGNMTIVISPKRSIPAAGDNVDVEFEIIRSHDESRMIFPPDKAANLSSHDVLDAIFHANKRKDASSVDIELEPDKSNEVIEDSVNEVENDLYPDDFSADVDNYNSRSEYENDSPISLPKTSEDENFWDS